MESTPKRKIKGSVFTNLFQDRKYLLQLYKALHPEDCNVTEDEIADITIKHVLVDAGEMETRNRQQQKQSVFARIEMCSVIVI